VLNKQSYNLHPPQVTKKENRSKKQHYPEFPLSKKERGEPGGEKIKEKKGLVYDP